MNMNNENITAYFVLAIYLIIGGLLRYLIIPTCNTELQYLNTIGGMYALPFIIIGISFGLFSFIRPKMPFSRVG